ncbi:diacylglycerol-acyltransferase [Hymenopellis radicata]|nr:diacylglycerol-acyltransferase [Hymenopellis radicata]
MAAITAWAVGIWGSQTLWMFLCCFPALWPILIAYQIHVFVDKGSLKGGRPSNWFRSCAWWMYYAAYFPITCVSTMHGIFDLPADKNYVFGYHPHGQGAFATFATEGTGFSKAFPGVVPHLLTLTTQFKLPFWRDVGLYTGCADVGKRSINYILRSGPGQSIAIVVGGAAESLSARPGIADLTLRRRFGFIKIAIQHGAPLVPVFGFGENNMFDQLPNEPGTPIFKFQKKFQSIFGFTVPIIHGRGMLNYTTGLLPHRTPVHTVFGRPIPVTKNPNPEQEEVLRLHEVYMEELLRIWDKYKDVYAKDRKKEMTFI